MQVILEKYLQFMDLGVLNYQKICKGRLHKLVARGVTGVNLPVLYLQKVLQFFPQSNNWCSSMVVVARKEKSLNA